MRRFFLLFIVIGFTNSAFCLPIQDILPFIRLESMAVETLRVSDLFYANDYAIQFEPNSLLNVEYDSSAGQIRLQAREHALGLTCLRFAHNGETCDLPVAIFQIPRTTLIYRPASPVSSVSVFGNFNNWNRRELYLQDDDQDGEYRITLMLEPGRYEYRFFVDEKEVEDALNPKKLANPFGEFNSLLDVVESDTTPFFLHQLKQSVTRQGLDLNFKLEMVPGKNDVNSIHSVVLLDNRLLGENHYRWNSNNELRVTLDTAQLKGNHQLRVAVSCGDRITPCLTIFLHDGSPRSSLNNAFIWQDAIVYSLMIDRFCNGDPANDAPIAHDSLKPPANYRGGDLAGIKRKIDEGYFDSLGINTLWISPVNDNTNQAFREWPEPHRFFSGYHGYWPVHHQRVEEHFGDMALLKNLVAAAHEKQTKILLDFIANHTHQDHPFFKEHRDWFGDYDLGDGRKNIRLWDEYRLTTWFEPFLPSFDFEKSTAAVNAMTDNALWWLQETGIDGFRHDAVKHVPNSFWRELTRKVKAWQQPGQLPPVYQIGETFGDYRLIHSYVNNGQLDGQFNFNLYYPARSIFLQPHADFTVLARELAKTHAIYGYNHLMGNLVDSHDQVRYMAYCDGDIDLNSGNAQEIGWTNPPRVDSLSSYHKVQLFLLFNLTIPGVPVLYYGDEIGMTGAADPDNRRMMRFGADLTQAEQSMLTAVRRIIALRRDHSALRYGDFYPVCADSAVFAFIRSDFNERVLVVFNKTPDKQTRRLPLPPWYGLTHARNLGEGGERVIPRTEMNMEIEPWSWQAWILE